MQVMILDGDKVVGGVLSAALRAVGFQVAAFDRAAPAKEVARRAILDLLVLGERVGGRLCHDLALLAEWRNPGLATILLTEREGPEREELFDLIPSLCAAIPRDADARTLARMTLAAARAAGARSRRTMAEEDEVGEDWPAALPPAPTPIRLRPVPVVGFLRPAPPRPAVAPRAAVLPVRPTLAPRRLHLA